MTRPVIIDLCKIGFISWGIVSVFLIFCFISESSAYLSSYVKPNFIKDFVGGQVSGVCYKGILDVDVQCNTIEWGASQAFFIGSIIFLFVNILNWYLWFVALNRKYKWYSFEFRSCNY